MSRNVHTRDAPKHNNLTSVLKSSKIGLMIIIIINDNNNIYNIIIYDANS